MRRRNPYPGVTRIVDRHGKVRYRFRKKGRASCYIVGDYGSKDFQVAYDQAIAGHAMPPSRRAARGTFSWLIEHYLRTPTYQKIGKVYKRNLARQMERFRVDHGQRSVVGLKPNHVEALIAKKASTPAAANELLKLMKRLCKFAIRRGVITTDPTYGVTGYATNPDGYHTWSDAEIIQFERHHGLASKAVLAMRLMLYTGAARQDAAALGWQNVKDGRIAYRRHKTGGDVDLPIHPDLAFVLEDVAPGQMLFVTHGKARAYKPTTFGNWFSGQCTKAKISHCSAHGLRKSGATRLADAGATELEIMAFLGHKSPDEARTYVKKANRAKLGDSGMKKLLSVSNPVERLDNHRRK